MENRDDDVRTEDLPDDLTPFITRTTLDPLAGGGFGDVWKCNFNHDTNDISALVAVKAFKLTDRYDLETINRRISREIGILKILRHKNIVPLWGIATGFGRMPELRCLVSPWMLNGTLDAYLTSSHNDLTVLGRSRMLEDISAGLRYLHSIPVMHGDITGANILIDERGHARLIDFGLSSIIQPLLDQSHLAATSIRPGAIRYAAPELVLLDNARDLGFLEKIDIYSFGCVMLQILSGRLPWSEITERLECRIVVMIYEGRGPQRPDGHPEIMDPDWNFIKKCLQSGPELRPSADEVLDFVIHRLSHPDSSSRPPDDPPDDAPGDSPGASPHGSSNDSDTEEQPPNSPPLHPDHEPKTHSYTTIRARVVSHPQSLQNPPSSYPTPSTSDKMSELIPITTPLREFKGHENLVTAVAVFPDKRRMVTGSYDKAVRLWDLKTGVVLKKMEGHHNEVWRLVISPDGQLIVSGDSGGDVIVWHGETGEFLTKIEAHSKYITSLDFSPDGTVLATSAYNDRMIKLWNTKTWSQQGNPIECGSYVTCVRYSPSGELLAIATDKNIQIYNPGTRKRVATFKADTRSLAWTPDGTRLLTGGGSFDPTIREWDTTSWKQVGDPWTGHFKGIKDIAIHPAGTLVASASHDNHVRLWRLSDRRTIAIFQPSSTPLCVTFSVDGNHILSGDEDVTISEWAVPQGFYPKILAITRARDACIDGHLSTAEELLTQDINTDDNNHTSYAHRSFVMARQNDWDHAIQDAIKSISIQPSLTGYISKGIALCGKGRVSDARAAFDVASMYTDQDPQILHFLLLIKVIVLFNADQQDEANLLLKELAAGCPNADTLACGVVQAYLHVQLGIEALDSARHEEAADHFTVVLNWGALSWSSPIHSMYEDLVVLFGWDLKSLQLTANQKRCDALLRAGKLQDAVKSYRYMKDNMNESTMASCTEWSNAFTEKCSALSLTSGDAAFAASDYDRAIAFYSAVIELNSASDAVFANRSKAKLGKMLWDDALLDAQKVTELNPSSHVGYQLTHATLHGAQRYDEAIEAFKIMLSKLDDSPEAQMQELRRQYVFPSEAEDAIRRAVWTELEYAPLRLLNTSTGLLCDRAAQINAFKMSAEYKELLSITTKHSDLQMGRIKEVVAMYFRCVMLSHRWEEKEALLHDIQDRDVRELNGPDGMAKLQSFCKVARDAGYRWAWMDTCCIDKTSITEVEESVNSMFVWYRHSALTIVYLSDVPPSSHPGALARSVWNERGWTFQEFVASKVVVFYQKDWSLYLDDRSPNHKVSPAIMKEVEDATGIDAQTLVTFRPGMSGAREKLQWASKRVTTLQEDVAYSLFGIFGITLPVIYGERKQNALGRLLQEIVARSGDISVLDWIGEPSEFNSCLPAHITSYTTPPCTLSPLSEDHIHTQITSLRQTVAADLALKFYDELEQLRAPRFANCRLHLPCISFRVTEVRRRRGPAQETPMTYSIRADGLHDLLITTEETLVQFWRARPIQQTFLLVRPWDRHLLGIPDFADDTESMGDWTEPGSPIDDSDKFPGGLPVEEEPGSRALRLMVRLGQPFDAFLLAQQRVGEYKRIASGYNITAQVKDIASVDKMDVGTVEIL